MVITRPSEQAMRLSELIRAAAGRPILFPALEIVDPPELSSLQRLIDRLDRFDLAVFVSPTAVRRGIALVRARRALPSGWRVAAVGPGSARELRRLGISAVIAPERGSDSEALLSRPELADMHGRSVVIFRGVGGRELLGHTLTARGALVEYAQCYRRTRPAADPAALLRAWDRGEVHAVSVMSGEALHNLFEMLGTSGQHRLRRTPLFVPHERIAQAARDLGIAQVVVTAAGDEELVSALIGHFSQSS